MDMKHVHHPSPVEPGEIRWKHPSEPSVEHYDEESEELFKSEEREEVKQGIDFAWAVLSVLVLGIAVFVCLTVFF